MATQRLQQPRRFAAWLLTGPVGHAAAAVADIGALAATLARERLRRPEGE